MELYFNTEHKMLYFVDLHLGTIHVNNQLDALFNVFIPLLYMFRETQWQPRWPSGMQVSDLHTRPSDSPDDEHWVVRNM